MRTALRKAVPLELGYWAAALPTDGGGVSLSAALRVDGTSFAELDAPLTAERGEAARVRLGWSMQQAESFVAFQQHALRAATTIARADAAAPEAAAAQPKEKKSLFARLTKSVPTKSKEMGGG